MGARLPPGEQGYRVQGLWRTTATLHHPGGFSGFRVWAGIQVGGVISGSTESLPLLLLLLLLMMMGGFWGATGIAYAV